MLSRVCSHFKHSQRPGSGGHPWSVMVPSSSTLSEGLKEGPLAHSLLSRELVSISPPTHPPTQTRSPHCYSEWPLDVFSSCRSVSVQPLPGLCPPASTLCRQQPRYLLSTAAWAPEMNPVARSCKPYTNKSLLKPDLHAGAHARLEVSLALLLQEKYRESAHRK